MFADEVEFVIAKAKLDVELKEWDNSLHPRDENGRFTEAGSFVGEGEKSQDIAQRITRIEARHHSLEMSRGTRSFNDATAIYKSENGNEYRLRSQIIESNEFPDEQGRPTFEAEVWADRVFRDENGDNIKPPKANVGGITFNINMGENYDNATKLTINEAWVSPAEQRNGVATAMLEFMRMESPVPVVHSTDLTEAGSAFASATKDFDEAILKYSPDQPRDELGRFGETGSVKLAADISKQEWLSAIEKINLSDVEQMRPNDMSGDSFVERLAQVAGINGKPALVESDYDLSGEPMYRGISDEKAEDMWGPVKPDGNRDFFPGERTSYKVFMDEFLHGDTSRFSSGNYGSGAYFSTSYSEAIGYSKLNPVDDVRIQDGEVLTGGFTSDARILNTSHNTWDDDMEKLYAQFEAVYPEVKEIAGIDIEHSIATKAMMLGWDGIKVAGASGTTGGDYFVVYNRGALEMVAK